MVLNDKNNETASTMRMMGRLELNWIAMLCVITNELPRMFLKCKYVILYK